MPHYVVVRLGDWATVFLCLGLLLGLISPLTSCPSLVECGSMLLIAIAGALGPTEIERPNECRC